MLREVDVLAALLGELLRRPHYAIRELLDLVAPARQELLEGAAKLEKGGFQLPAVVLGRNERLYCFLDLLPGLRVPREEDHGGGEVRVLA